MAIATAQLEMTQEESKPTKIEKTTVIFLAVIAVFLTVFDGLSSWLSITMLNIAFEGNFGLMALTNYTTFEVVMGIRILWGIIGISVLTFMALRFKTHKARGFAKKGLYFIVGILWILMGYHIYVLVLGLLQGLGY